MARKIIDIGLIGNDGTGDSIRDSFRKVNENFYELYGSLGLGERLAFTNLGDTPDGYEGLSNNDNITAVLTVNSGDDPDGLIFKQIISGEGVNILYPEESNEIVIGLDFDSIYSQELLATSVKLGEGISISEFSTDSTFSNNSYSSVPVEYAIRTYIDKRLGITHTGSVVPSNEIIPAQGGFLPLSGQVPMRGDIDLQDPDIANTYHKIINLDDPVDDKDATNKSYVDTEIANAVSGGAAIIDDIIADDAAIQQHKLDLNIAEALATAPAGTAAEIQAANGITSFDSIFFTVTNGWVTLKDDSITLPKLKTLNARTVLGNELATAGPVAELDLDDILTGGSGLTNANIADDAGIEQSKLAMNLAIGSPDYPSGTAEDKQARSGLASFNSWNFEVIDGYVTIKDYGVEYDKIQWVNARSLLGNAGYAPAALSEVSFDTIVNDAGGVKKSQYTALGFLRRKNSTSNVLDSDYEIIDMSVANSNNTLIQRDSNGDFAARIANVKQLKVDSHLTIDTQVISAGGAIRLYGWEGNGGVIIQGGPNATDKATYYDNDAHKFRTQDGTSYAPIRAGSVETTAITSGSETTPGTIEGYWSLVGNSRLESTYSADLAEFYEGDKEYPQGTVLIFGGEKEVTVSNAHMDTKVAGVVSHDAAFAMFKACPGYKNLIALQGRVPCRVVGKISKGDLLITSTLPGVAVSAKDNAKAGSIIGKAIENYDSDHIGMITVAVGRA